MNDKMKKEVSKERKLDQFYTTPKYAKYVISIAKQKINFDQYNVHLEPSAGDGSFLLELDKLKRIGLDIDPKLDEIISIDFFEWKYPTDMSILTIGNPPFGKNASLAIQFFNHAAKFSDAIVFILPRTFRKTSVINKLDSKFHLLHDEIVPPKSFLHNNKPYDVTCCTQIWIKKDSNREKIPTFKISQLSEWFEIVDAEESNFAIQRVGTAAGKIKTTNFKHLSKLSNYFIKAHHPFVIDVFNNIDFQEVKHNTAGNPSISPSEIVELWIDQAIKQGYHIKIVDNPNTK